MLLILLYQRKKNSINKKTLHTYSYMIKGGEQMLPTTFTGTVILSLMHLRHNTIFQNIKAEYLI